MITRISLKNIASYGMQAAVLKTDKKNNFIYGLNGTGKTVLSEFLANYGKDENTDYKFCELEGKEENEEILVYNHHFVEDNFYEKDKIKGIFTIGEQNKEAEEAIKKAEKEKKNLEEKRRECENESEKLKEQLAEKQIQIKEKIWEIKKTYSDSEDKSLDFCLEGLRGVKEILFNHIYRIEKTENKPEKTIEELKKEGKLLAGNAERIDENSIPKIAEDFKSVEANTIFEESIIGNENSMVAELIKKLDNSDWVKQGEQYIQEGDETCPFCQQPTLTEELKKEIKDYFDKTYEEKKEGIKTLEEHYKSLKNNIKSEKDYLNNFIPDKSIIDRFKNLYCSLINRLSNNLNKIENKQNNLSQKVTLESSQVEVEEFNRFIEEQLKKIRRYNEKIEHKERTTNEIKTSFWQIMRWDYDSQIDDYNKCKQEKENKLQEINQRIQEITQSIGSEDETIRKCREKTINVEKAMDNINEKLKDLGIDGFEIKPVPNEDRNKTPFYQLVRENSEEETFKTLSEGEKTMISFLYFLELCKGALNTEEISKKKIVVIDDPISSLSHSYVFNVAQMIKKQFLNKTPNDCVQIFILTHNLYFFHELIKICDITHTKLFRVVKNQNSEILCLEKNEIQNDYQAYWQVLKDHNDGKASDALLANTMRNILEYFFGFIERSKMREAIRNIKNKENNNEYEHFIRYMDRESHYDNTNISDFKEIKAGLFKDCFKEVFEKSGFEDHYKKMME